MDDNNTEDKYNLYNTDYFTSVDQTRGYRGEGYRDYPLHWRNANIIYDY